MPASRFAGRGVSALLVTGLLWFATAQAEQDHLTGFRVRDLDGNAPSGTITISDENGTQTCTLRKATLLLTPSEKNGGDDPRGGEAGHFVCYKAKCSGDAPPIRQYSDQFQTHSLRTTKAKLVCLPATHVCGDGKLDPPEQCDGNDAAACLGACLADCTCPHSCKATTGGFCWFNGPSGASCDAVCVAEGRVYDSATESFAGSGGTDANCQAVIADLGINSQMFTGGQSCLSFGLGCCYADTGTMPSFRCATPTTTSSAATSLSRICACQ